MLWHLHRPICANWLVLSYTLLYYCNTVQCGAKYSQSQPTWAACTYIIVYCRLIFAQVYFRVVLSAASQYASSRLSDWRDTLFNWLHSGDPIYPYCMCILKRHATIVHPHTYLTLPKCIKISYISGIYFSTLWEVLSINRGAGLISTHFSIKLHSHILLYYTTYVVYV